MYITARGGEEAIQQAEQLFHDLKAPLKADFVAAVEANLPYLLDRVMGEASLYAPEYAALAVSQTGGDLCEAVMLLRAYRSTQPRIAYAKPIEAEDMFVVRRISAAFKDIPGGQVLGPTLDYSHRLLHTHVLEKSHPDNGREAVEAPSEGGAADPAGEHAYPYVADWHRAQGLLPPRPETPACESADIPDLTREPLLFPSNRPHRLQALARSDTGGALALGYAHMRGYGAVHPTVNELRLAYAEVRLTHPATGAEFSAGRIRVSQAEVVAPSEAKEGESLELGFAATMGWNEVKVISAAMLDLAMNQPEPHPAHEEEFVLYHTEAVEASGFCIHYKLPHYVTFGSDLDAVRRVAVASGWHVEEGAEEDE
jgi:alpha-D-ribose 1-methylphosphonate 5-triphosphate synthase subunit PhnI